MSFEGKVVVVTGASSGIGAAIARRLAKSGAYVVGLARSVDKMEKLADMAPNKNFHPRYCDMAKEKDIVDGIAWTVTKFGTIDVLINCAGVCEVASQLDGSTDKWRRMLEVNVLGLCIATREAIKTMRINESGHIVNINSVAGHDVPHIHRIPVGMYSATKHALTALTESLRYELQDIESKIKVSSISPGPVFTEMYMKIFENEKIKIPGDVRIPEDFLATDEIVNTIMSILMTSPNVLVQDVSIRALGHKGF